MTALPNLELHDLPHQSESSDGHAAVNFLSGKQLKDTAVSLLEAYGEVLRERTYVALKIKPGALLDQDQPWLGRAPTTYEELALSFTRDPETNEPDNDIRMWEINDGASLTTVIMDGAQPLQVYVDSGRGLDGTTFRRTILRVGSPDFSEKFSAIAERTKKLAGNPTELIWARDRRNRVTSEIAKAMLTAGDGARGDLKLRLSMIEGGALKAKQPTWAPGALLV